MGGVWRNVYFVGFRRGSRKLRTVRVVGESLKVVEWRGLERGRCSCSEFGGKALLPKARIEQLGGCDGGSHVAAEVL